MSPALDFAKKTADTAHDVSSSATASATAVNLGRSGLAKGEKCTVVVTEASAANFDTRQLRFYFEYTTDNGSTWHRSGAADGKISSAGIPKQIVEMAIEADIVPEQNAEGDIDWRVTADIGSTLSTTDDYQFQAFLGNISVGAQAPIN